ncbi:methyltransferase domain-containing protein [Luteimonas sp BLCC-B24]|uniref:class I SAM-dependent methyltransferase n=1 Tax=Luteimonas sp. BLCC-B24 TaxID=3025317 RepID=UPI00234CFF59|nr:methyltransferase domain-containing protein [Luteimonas sp. BLCC-B24]MDC7807209.1 methyltransferase domain-containing protein [Luteimonas sp. BLCC-B24]
MPGYSTRISTVDVGAHSYRLRMLTDLQQYADPDGHGARLGISSAQWPLFGHLWPSGRLLAQVMARTEIAGLRILEMGCGIGLSSLVLQRRGADVVASDMHPLAEGFLAYNAALNALDAVHYRHMCWDEPLASLGRFDMIIASDVLYERGHAVTLAGVVARHARPDAVVMLTDPGRGHSTAFGRLLHAQGFTASEARLALDGDPDTAPRGRLLHYRRGAPAS